MANSGTRSQTTVITLTLVPPAKVSTMSLYQVADFFSRLHKVIVDLRLIASSNRGVYDMGVPDVMVIRLELHSPLKISLDMGATPKEVVKALVGLLEKVLFYREERAKRGALAAAEWEHVYEQRLANIKTAIEIITSAESERLVNEDTVNRLVSSAMRLELLDLQLEKVETEE